MTGMVARLDAELRVAIEAVRAAAGLCRRVQAHLSPDCVATKEDGSLVTAADFGSQAMVCRAVAEKFPDDAIIAEEDGSLLTSESGRPILEATLEELSFAGAPAAPSEACEWIRRGVGGGRADRFWTLDPIDGTTGFLQGRQYAVCLALIAGGRVELGVLACPELEWIADASAPRGGVFYAVRGEGAWSLPLEGGGEPPRPLRVSSQKAAAGLRFCESVERGHQWRDGALAAARQLGADAPAVRLDSQAKYVLVARGEADVYLRVPRRRSDYGKIWDHSGGALLVEEAGGTVTDVDGAALDFTRGRRLSANYGIIASNGLLHGEVAAAIQAVVGGAGVCDPSFP